MACPVCNRTMQNLGLDTAGRRSFWCPSCGTVKTEATGGHSTHESPRITLLLKQSDEASLPNELRWEQQRLNPQIINGEKVWPI